MTHISPNDLTLRDAVESDLEIFFAHQAEPAATEMAHFPARERDVFFPHWRRILADPALIAKTIVVDGEVVGNIVRFEQESMVLVGYWLGSAYWGRGFATNALAALLAETDERPLHAYVAKRNIGLRRVLEKCGFVLEREEDEEYLFRLGESER